MIVRKARKEDFVEVHKLLLQVFSSARVKIGPNDEFIVADEGGELVGFAHICENRKRIILKGFGVIHNLRGKGIGSGLLDELIAYSAKIRKNIHLKTRVGCPALSLYYKKGFATKRIKGNIIMLAFMHPN